MRSKMASSQASPGANAISKLSRPLAETAFTGGLYFLDTRIISNWAIYANGEEWELLNGGPISYHAARIFLTNKSILTADGRSRYNQQ
jgi:hypothetical protein